MNTVKVRSDCKFDEDELNKIVSYKLEFMAATISERMTLLKKSILPALEYFTLPHRVLVESTWSPRGLVESMWSPCGFHVDFTKKVAQIYEICAESMRSPCGVHVESMWTPYGPCGPMDSTYTALT
jgi:hypothetical protein